MDRRTHAGANVRGARGDYTKLIVVGTAPIDEGFDNVDGCLEAVKDLVENAALLHAHDAEMILFSDPDDETLVLANVAASTVRPVLGDASGEEVLVCGHVLEHDVIFYELVVFVAGDLVGVTWSDGHVATSELRLADQCVKDLTHCSFHGDTVVFGHGSWKRKLFEVSAGSHAHGQRRKTKLGQVENAVGRKTSDATERPVIGVLGLGEIDLVVLLESTAEEGLEDVVVIRLTRVAAHDGIRVLDSRIEAFEESRLDFLGELVVVLLVESLQRNVLRVVALQLQDPRHFVRVCLHSRRITRTGSFFLLQKFDTLVEGSDNLGFRDAEPGRGRDVDSAILTNWGVLAS